jgi:hypothetical protein
MIESYDMGRFHRLVGVDGPRVRGTFVVMGTKNPDKEVWVKAHDVVIWDEGHNSGICFYSNDLTASVKDGVAELSKHMVKSSLLADVEDVWDEMLEVLVAAVEGAKFDE